MFPTNHIVWYLKALLKKKYWCHPKNVLFQFWTGKIFLVVYNDHLCLLALKWIIFVAIYKYIYIWSMKLNLIVWFCTSEHLYCSMLSLVIKTHAWLTICRSRWQIPSGWSIEREWSGGQRSWRALLLATATSPQTMEIISCVSSVSAVLQATMTTNTNPVTEPKYT